MNGRLDFVSWGEGVLEKTAREQAFSEKLAAYCATLRMIDATLGNAMAAGDDDLVAAIKDERARYQRDHFPAVLAAAKELTSQ